MEWGSNVGHVGVQRESRARGLVPGVRPHVPRDHVPPARGIRALGTLVRLFPGVGPLVRRQVIRSREDLATDSARVRLEPRVQPHVPGQHVGPSERAVAHVAGIGF